MGTRLREFLSFRWFADSAKSSIVENILVLHPFNEGCVAWGAQPLTEYVASTLARQPKVQYPWSHHNSCVGHFQAFSVLSAAQVTGSTPSRVGAAERSSRIGIPA